MMEASESSALLQGSLCVNQLWWQNSSKASQGLRQKEMGGISTTNPSIIVHTVVCCMEANITW